MVFIELATLEQAPESFKINIFWVFDMLMGQ